MSVIYCHNEGNPVTFIHNPKAAGTSIADWIWSSVGYKNTITYRNHWTLDEVRDMMKRDHGITDLGTTFGIVRNPYDRALSAYAYLRVRFEGLYGWQNICSEQERVHNFHELNQGFEYFLKSEEYYKRKYEVMMPQLFWLKGVDRICKMETLLQDFDPIAGLYKVQQRSKIPFHNVSHRLDDWKPFYNDTCKAIIEKHFGKDIETFEYDFDTPIKQFGRDQYWEEKMAKDKAQIKQEAEDLNNLGSN